jgi:hypothetical protein
MYPESKSVKWLFPQEKVTLKIIGKGTLTLVPLEFPRMFLPSNPQQRLRSRAIDSAQNGCITNDLSS